METSLPSLERRGNFHQLPLARAKCQSRPGLLQRTGEEAPPLRAGTKKSPCGDMCAEGGTTCPWLIGGHSRSLLTFKTLSCVGPWDFLWSEGLGPTPKRCSFATEITSSRQTRLLAVLTHGLPCCLSRGPSLGQASASHVSLCMRRVDRNYLGGHLCAGDVIQRRGNPGM